MLDKRFEVKLAGSFATQGKSGFRFIVGERDDSHKPKWNRLPKDCFRECAHLRDFVRSQCRRLSRFSLLNGLRRHPLERRDGRGDERQFCFRDRQNIAIRQKRFVDRFAVDARAVGATQIANRPDVPRR